MFYVIILLFMAVIFGLCFLADRLLKKIRPAKSGKAVRPPHRGLAFGILLICLGAGVLFSLWEKLNLPLKIGCLFVAAMGVFLLVQYYSFVIIYDDDGFYCREKPGALRRWEYADIIGQRSFLTRSGVNTTLYFKNGEVHLYEALDGVQALLSTAFYAWCRATGTEPDSVQANRDMLTWFPEPQE